MVRLATQLIIAALLASALPVAADHVPTRDIDWACGFGGSGSTGHPSNCGINPVGGGFEVGAEGPASWGESWTRPDQPVLGIVMDGDARAIPVIMLDSHEIANIEVAGQPIAVTYCPLCGSGVAFRREVAIAGETQTLTFAASGFLYQSDLVMWDPQTGTLWNQISGTPIGTLVGESVDRGHEDVRLETVPMVVTNSAAWSDAHPESVMLQKVRLSYGNPYGSYDEDGDRCGLGSCRGADGRLHPKELVIGVADPAPIAFPLFGLDAPGAVAQVEVAGRTLLATAAPAGGHRVLDATGLGLDNATGRWLDSEGHTWDLVANLNDAGASMPEVDSLRLFWFAWAEHYPDSELWQPSADAGQPLQKDNGKLPGFTIPIVAAFLVAGALAYRYRRR